MPSRWPEMNRTKGPDAIRRDDGKMITTQKSTDWTSRYGDALRTFVDGHYERMSPAPALGREAAYPGRDLSPPHYWR